MMRYLALAAGLVWLMTSSASAQNATLVQAGKQLYSSKECARCHMVAGKGNKMGKLDRVASKVSAKDIRKWLTAPAEMEAKLDHKPKVRMSSRRAMKLTDADVAALQAYLMTLK
jgi:mono/diheme cytochrome c family protein